MPAKPKHFLLILLLAVACPTFLVGQNCSIQQLEGTYLLNSMDYAYIYPTTELGVLRVDHAGSVTGSIVIVMPGPAVVTTPVASTWTVAPDCTLTATTGTGATFKGVVVNNGDEIHLLQTGPTPLVPNLPGFPPMPTVTPHTLYRMSPGANTVNKCSARDLTGTYAAVCNGWQVLTPLPNLAYLPFSFVGSISSPGDGTFSGSGYRSYAFQAPLITFKNGTITLNSDCTGSTNFQIEGVVGTFTQRIVAFDQGKRMIATTDSGQQIDICQYYRLSKQ